MLVDVRRHRGDVNFCAAEAACPSTGYLGRQPQTGVMHCVFPGGPGALLAMFGEVGIDATRQVGVRRRSVMLARKVHLWRPQVPLSCERIFDGEAVLTS